MHHRTVKGDQPNLVLVFTRATLSRYASAGTSYGPVIVCPSVCLSQVGVLSKGMDRLIWFLACGFLSISLTLSVRYTSKNKGTSLLNFAPNSGLRKFRHGISIVEMCYRLILRKMDAQSVKNWTVVGQLSWDTPSFDSRLLVSHTDRRALSTARFHRAGQSATADTRYVLILRRCICRFWGARLLLMGGRGSVSQLSSKQLCNISVNRFRLSNILFILNGNLCSCFVLNIHISADIVLT